MVVVDFAGVEDFEAMPNGVYWVEVKECTVGKSKSKGETMFKMMVEVIDSEEHDGRKFWPNLMLEGKGMRFTKQAFTSLQLEPGEIDPQDLVGLTAPVRITQKVRPVDEGGSGKPESRISSWIDPDVL